MYNTTSHIKNSLHLPLLAAKTVAGNTGDTVRLSDDTFLEMEAEASKALIECGQRWPIYCEENAYDPDRLDYFQAFAMRRMKGSIIDMWRRESPLSRNDINFLTYSNKHGSAGTAKEFNMTEDEVRLKIDGIKNILNTHHLDDPNNAVKGMDEPEAVQQESMWEVLYPTTMSLPFVCRVWISLVYVQSMPPKDAEKLLGLPKGTVSRYTEYKIVRAVLENHFNTV